MTTRTTRRVRLARMGLLAAAWMLASLPPQVQAQALPIGCQLGNTYTGDQGTQVVNNPMAPPLLNIARDAPVGTVVFQGALPPIPYTCQSGSAFSLTYGPALAINSNFTTIIKPKLVEAGLGLRLKFPGIPVFVPTAPGTDGSGYQILPNYPRAYSPVSGVLTGTLELFVDKPITKPMQIEVPATTNLFTLIHGPGRPMTNNVAIGSSSTTWVRILPAQCLVKVSVPNTIDLSIAYAADVFPLPAPRFFSVNVALNPDCEGFGDPANWGHFVLPLDIMFDVPGTSMGNLAVALKNDAGDPNGLDLVIKQGGAIAVPFNQWHSAVSLSAAIPMRNLSYSASLERNGTQMKTGKFSQQVIVRVRYL